MNDLDLEDYEELYRMAMHRLRDMNVDSLRFHSTITLMQKLIIKIQYLNDSDTSGAEAEFKSIDMRTLNGQLNRAMAHLGEVARQFLKTKNFEKLEYETYM